MDTITGMSAIKGTSRRVWMSDTEIQTLKEIGDAIKLGQTEILSQIIRAGLESISANGNRMNLPLSFTVGQSIDVPRYQVPQKEAPKTQVKR